MNPKARTWQQAEGAGLALGGLAIAALAAPGWPWWVWPLVLAAPELAAAAYVAGVRAGAAGYNLAHLYALPFLLMVAGVMLGLPQAIAGGGLWLAHIGAERAFGWGFRLTSGFRQTHLGAIGRS